MDMPTFLAISFLGITAIVYTAGETIMRVAQILQHLGA